MAQENVFIHIGAEVYTGHVVKKARLPQEERDAAMFAFRIAETLQISATEAAIMIARLDLAGLEITRKADGM